MTDNTLYQSTQGDETERINFPELKELPSLATASQVACILKCSRRHVLNECHAGRIEFVNIRPVAKVPVESLLTGL